MFPVNTAQSQDLYAPLLFQIQPVLNWHGASAALASKQRNGRTKIWPHACTVTDQLVEAGRDLNSTDLTVTPVKKRFAERHRIMMEK